MYIFQNNLLILQKLTRQKIKKKYTPSFRYTFCIFNSKLYEVPGWLNELGN